MKMTNCLEFLSGRHHDEIQPVLTQNTCITGSTLMKTLTKLNNKNEATTRIQEYI